MAEIVRIILIPSICFILVLADHNINEPKVEEAKNSTEQWCGNVDRNAMGTFSYISDSDFNGTEQINGREVQILIAPNSLGKGKFAEVFVGYFGTKEDKFSATKCIALRLSKRIDEAENGFNILRQMQRYFRGKSPKHIVFTFDIGRSTTNGDYVTVMELADSSYEKGYKPVDFHAAKDGERLEGHIKKMVVPLVVMHKVAIHADLRLTNYVLKGKTAKLIDFDGSIALFRAKRQSLKNQLFKPVWPARYDAEAGPEYKDSNNALVSTKTDIWAIGILAYELILRQPKLALEQNSRKELLGKIAEIYRGYKWVDTDIVDWQNEWGKAMVKRSVDLDYGDGKWLAEYRNALMLILGVRKEMPHIFLLLSNLLNQTHSDRMPAKEVLKYLRNKCILVAPEQPVLFAGITRDRLGEMIDKKLAKMDARNKNANTSADELRNLEAELREMKQVLTESDQQRTSASGGKVHVRNCRFG